MLMTYCVNVHHAVAHLHLQAFRFPFGFAVGAPLRRLFNHLAHPL
jgi:hypothetical protein